MNFWDISQSFLSTLVVNKIKSNVSKKKVHRYINQLENEKKNLKNEDGNYYMPLLLHSLTEKLISEYLQASNELIPKQGN